MKKLAVLTGAGISAESGISTFRDAGGLWEGHPVMEVASPQGWKKNPALVLDFYNKRRKQLLQVYPNTAHVALVELEKKFHVCIITQNVDDLHERAGSSHIIHLHGELLKSRGVGDPNSIYDCKEDIKIGDKCKNGHQLRPHIVWFGEMVPKMEEAISIVSEAEILIVIGSSMVVYPAASLVDYVQKDVPIFVVNKEQASFFSNKNITYITKNATEGVSELVTLLLNL